MKRLELQELAKFYGNGKGDNMVMEDGRVEEN